MEAIALVGLGLGAYQAHQSQQQAREAGRESKRANAQQLALQQQQLEQMNRQPQEQADATMAGRARQRALAAAAFGRGDTVATSPLGAIGAAPTAQKSLIGS